MVQVDGVSWTTRQRLCHLFDALECRFSFHAVTADGRGMLPGRPVGAAVHAPGPLHHRLDTMAEIITARSLGEARTLISLCLTDAHT